MPICIADELPAVAVLREENIFVMSQSRAQQQNIRPLELLLLNLMPKKIETENQILRLLANSPLQIRVQLLRIDQRISKNTPQSHLNNFYCDFAEIEHKNFDGLIITGAPLGLVAFNDVVYWQQIKTIINWAKTHVTSTLFICWAVQAALNILYEIPKYTRKNKLSGIYEHQTLSKLAPLTRGFDDHFFAPHSRYADFPLHLVEQIPHIEILAQSEIAGPYLFATNDRRMVFVTGHPEYDAHTLANEYHRDIAMNLAPSIPLNYFPNDDINQPPIASWRSHGNLLISNWLNYYVYQITPFDLATMNPTLE